MMLLMLFLTAVVAAVALTVGAHLLWTFVRDDGVTLPSWQRTPPRSHHPDPFDPRSRMA